MKLKWPFDHFPEDHSTWECCQEKYLELKKENDRLKEALIRIGMNLKGLTKENITNRSILCYAIMSEALKEEEDGTERQTQSMQ